jgi:iron(III) transport system permease protein
MSDGVSLTGGSQIALGWASAGLRRVGTILLLAIAAGLVLAPVLAVIYGALRSRSPGAPRAVFTWMKIEQTWGGLFTGGWTQTPTINTILLAVPVTLAATALGVLLAWAVTRTDMPFRRGFEVMFLVPLLYSPLVGVIGWTVLGDPRAGLLNQFWAKLTGLSDPLIDVYSYSGIAWVMVFYFAPYAFLLCAGAFRALDSTLEEAAAMSGANLFRRLSFVTFPIMAAGIGAAALFIFTLALEQFAIPGFLGAHVHFETLAYAIFQRTNAYPSDLPGAAAAGTLLLVLSSLGLYAYRRMTRHSERFVTVTARGYRPVPTALGSFGPVLAGICAVLALLGVVLPLAAVLLRALLPVRTATLELSMIGFDNFTALLHGEDILLGLRNTAWLAVGAASLCGALGLLIGFLIVRRKSTTSTILDYLVALPIGIPGTVFGVGMLWAYVGTPIYLTLWILLLAFVVRYLVYAVRTVSGGMMQIDKVLEESAAIAGGDPWRSFLFVDLPLLKPAIASAWLLVFLIVMREISASVILYGANSVTLPILTWSYLNDGSYGIASALAVAQVVIVGAVVLLLRRVFGADIRARSD